MHLLPSVWTLLCLPFVKKTFSSARLICQGLHEDRPEVYSLLNTCPLDPAGPKSGRRVPLPLVYASEVGLRVLAVVPPPLPRLSLCLGASRVHRAPCVSLPSSSSVFSPPSPLLVGSAVRTFILWEVSIESFAKESVFWTTKESYMQNKSRCKGTFGRFFQVCVNNWSWWTSCLWHRHTHRVICVAQRFIQSYFTTKRRLI